MPTKKLKVWVTRDNMFPPLGSFYNVYLKRPIKKQFVPSTRFPGSEWRKYDSTSCPEIFEKHFFKLKPGQGPVEAEITIKRRGAK